MKTASRRQILFLRLGLGVGGGERWAIDAARALAEAGHAVRRVVTGWDGRALPDVNEGLLPVEIPRAHPPLYSNRLRLLRALWQFRRTARAAARLPDLQPDVIVLDSVAHLAPLVRRLWPAARLRLYCHFPEAYMATPHGGPVRALYRRWMHALERRGMLACHTRAANSRFTAEKMRAFVGRPLPVTVIHPGVRHPHEAPPWPKPPADVGLHALVVGRFDPDKRPDFALDAWAALQARLPAVEFARCRLTFAGGCDRHRPLSSTLRGALLARVAAAGWSHQVRMLPEPTPTALEAAFAQAHCLVHPMAGEHFGIAPVEAMARGRPVLAVAGAGPDETVIEGVTGALRPDDPQAFAAVLAKWAREPARLRAMSAAARARAADFSLENFAQRWVPWTLGEDLNPSAPATEPRTA